MGKKGKKRRRYSDEERATAVAAVAANKGNVQRTAKQLGIPEKTLEHWVKGTFHPEAAKNGELKKAPLAEHLRGVAYQLADGMTPEKIREAPLEKQALSLGIVVDKMRLLEEKPTGITRTENADDDLSKLTDEEFERRFGEVRARAAAEGAGPSPQAPVGSVPIPNGSRKA